MVTQFSGESAFDAIVNENCLDIEQQEDFEAFINLYGSDITDTLQNLQDLFDRWNSYQLTNG